MGKLLGDHMVKRREFLSRSVSAGMFLAGGGAPAERELEAGGGASTSYAVEVTIERPQAGKPHRGKVLAAIQPHCDDIPIYAGGTVLKLLEEGYTGVLITLSNDSMAGRGSSIGDIVLRNERDTEEVAKRLGLAETFFLNYPNHYMDAWSILEIRARLIFLFRLLKVDTVIGLRPSALYERNPDHYITAAPLSPRAAMAASEWDYPEHFKAGLKPTDRARSITSRAAPNWLIASSIHHAYIDAKVFANLANRTQGPSGDTGARCAKNWRPKSASWRCWARTMTPPIAPIPSNSRWNAIAPEAWLTAWNMPSTSTTFRPISPTSKIISTSMPRRFETG